MHELFEDVTPRKDEIRVAFSRAARLALAGLLVPPALLSVAAAAGVPWPAAAEPVSWLGAIVGFGGAGWFAGRQLGAGRRRSAALAGAFLAAALPTAPAFHQLQGLTGRESLLAVAAFALAAFCLAFALTGLLSARALGITGIGARGVAACAAGGVAGGAFAILPFGWAWMRLDVPGESYLVMTLAIAGFLGSLIAPFHVVGRVLDRVRRGTALARA